MRGGVAIVSMSGRHETRGYAAGITGWSIMSARCMLCATGNLILSLVDYWRPLDRKYGWT